MYGKLSDKDAAEFYKNLGIEFMNVPENKEILEEITDYPIIPNFEPNTTVLYTSYEKLDESCRSHWVDIIQQSAKRLYCNGFYHHVVDSGCDFGLIALRELLKIRNEKKYNLTIYAGRSRGHIVKNNAHSLIQQVILLCESKNFGVQTNQDFFTRVVQQSGAIVSDKGYVLMTDTVSES